MKLQLNCLETNTSYIILADIIEETSKNIPQFIRAVKNTSSFLMIIYGVPDLTVFIFYFYFYTFI